MSRHSVVMGEPFQLRSYQAEMVEASMRENVIVAMDTGSGKTHIAIERARAELEICDPFVWFLTPTVTLCEQQYKAFKYNLPGYGIQMLTGQDGVDRWTEQSEWDRVLANVRVVLSTHQVLVDALDHAFVRMENLALLIFDEAHHAIRNHPARRIMSHFNNARDNDQDAHVPWILGLSASPVMRANATIQSLHQIEQNLHAVIKTPILRHSELIRYVHKPELVQIQYRGDMSETDRSDVLLALERLFLEYDIMQDPYLIELVSQQDKGYDVSTKIQKTLASRKTYCNEQLRMLWSKAKATCEELGPSPTDWYVHQCVTQFQDLASQPSEITFEWTAEEKKHLLRLLRDLPFQQVCPLPPLRLDGLSLKVETLINTLVSEAPRDTEFTGLVFIEQRIWVAILAKIISVHPKTKNLFRVGTFVGTSQNGRRKASIATLAEPMNQQTTLDDFRSGSLNLILATSVLEEGIDISSCHLVICFERPKNLKSFVQRRGRARRVKSRYLIFNAIEETQKSKNDWQALEKEMRAAYMDDMRRVKQAEQNELQEEDGQRSFHVAETGAMLTLHNATPHLHHFCAILTSNPYVDTRPQFSFEEDQSGRITAKVVLPISVDPSLRNAESEMSWSTEKMARNDAAFVVYKSLYLAGLVNEHLLPSREDRNDDNLTPSVFDNPSSFLPASVPFDPWAASVAHSRAPEYLYYQALVRLTTKGEEPIQMIVLLPMSCPAISTFLLHWNNFKSYEVAVSWSPCRKFHAEEVQTMREITYHVLQSVYCSRLKESRFDFLWLLVPCNAAGEIPSPADLRDFQATITGNEFLSDRLAREDVHVAESGLVLLQGKHRRYIPRRVHIGSSPKDPSQVVPLLQVVRLPKKRNFLHVSRNQSTQKAAYTRQEELPVQDCFVQNLPTSYALFALLLPSILHKLELYMVADELRKTIISPVGLDISILPVLVAAITSSAANASENYQRLEFLGDCILKYVTSVHLMAKDSMLPEQFLTERKGNIVSNYSLARAALAGGLDRFIVFDGFGGAKWAPKYFHDVVANVSTFEKILRSSKVIADVMESLIGASYVAGGVSKAFLCIRTLLPLEPWTTILEAAEILRKNAPADCTGTGLETLEALVGHTFSKKVLLLDALTHASFSGANVHSSYERLEFLGDAVLDYIVSTKLFAKEPLLSHRKMHTIRTAIVNASFLAFCMFETTITEEITDKATMQPSSQLRALWNYMRCSNHQLATARDTALQQHEEARELIKTALDQDTRYPWHLLALTNPPKFLSDIVESMIGAIYVDTTGDIGSCESFVRRLGMYDCMERIMRESVDCLHPKERLGHLAVDKEVQYLRVTESRVESVAAMGESYGCQVIVGGEDVGSVVEARGKLNAETIAAFKAVTLMEVAIEGRKRKAEEEEFDE